MVLFGNICLFHQLYKVKWEDKCLKAYGNELMYAGIPVDRDYCNKTNGDFHSVLIVFRLVVGVRMIDVLGPEKRRRRSVQEKIAIVQQSFEPGMTVSLVARQHGVAASQLFLWRKQYQEGSLTAVAAGEQVVPASELASAMKQIKELQRLLGKKTMENELLKEAVEYGRQKKWIAHVPLLPEDGE